MKKKNYIIARTYQRLAREAGCLHASPTDQEAFRTQPLSGELRDGRLGMRPGQRPGSWQI